MLRIRTFRLVVLASWVLMLTVFFRPFLWEPTDPRVLKLLEFDGYHAVLNLYKPGLITIFSTIPFWLSMIAVTGIFFFQRWSRHFFLALNVFTLATTFLFGIRIATPIDALLSSTVDLINGAILALVFLTPLKENFACTPLKHHGSNGDTSKTHPIENDSATRP